MMAHPSFETLLHYVEGRLSEVELRAVEAHLALACEPCGRDTARLRAVLETLTDDRSAAPPPAVLRKAISAHLQMESAPAAQPLRVLAEILFDSRLQFSQASVRGAAEARQLLFTADPNIDIDLRIVQENEKTRMVGQIIAPEQGPDPEAVVCLRDEAGKVLQEEGTGPTGQFVFGQVLPGVYDLVFDLKERQVVVTGLDVRS